MKRGLAWTLALFAVLALLLLGLTTRRVAERGRFARAYSSYGSGPTGVRALYLVLAELGWKPQRWSQDLAHLPARGTLVALGDCETRPARRLSRYEREELLRWVDQGGLLLVAGARHYLPGGLDVEFEFDPSCPAPRSDNDSEPAAPTPASPPPTAAGLPDAGLDAGTPAALDAGSTPPLAAAGSGAPDAGVDDDSNAIDETADAGTWAIPMGPALAGLPIVRFQNPGHFRVADDADVETLLGAPESAEQSSTGGFWPLGLVLRHGQGHVIVLAAANMVQNGEIASSAGATLFRRLLQSYAGGGPVLFDEYHLGVGERRSLMQYLRQLGGMPLLFQLLLAVLLVLWRAGARLGAVQADVEAAAGGTISFVTALGRLYQAAGDKSAAVRLIARAALARIAAHHGVHAVQSAALDKALGERHASDAQQAVRTIVAAVSSTRSEALPLVVQRIDAAVASALADGVAKPSGSTHEVGQGMLPPRRS